MGPVRDLILPPRPHNMSTSYTKLSAYYLFWTCVLLSLVKHGTAQENLRFTVEEEQPPQTMIGVIESACVPKPYHIIWSRNSRAETDLDVNGTTGVIRTKRPLDREKRAHYTFFAIPVSGTGNCGSSNIKISVHIDVSDINDHTPEFPSSVMELSLSESSPRDVKYSLGSAVDPDEGFNSTQRYEIASGNTNNTFRLGSKRSQNGILYLDLEINGALDYETMPSYSLVIHAYDGRNRYGSLRVNISIIDVNDNSPIFNQSRYSARVKENATVGTPIVRVFATDQDSGENGKILYYIDRQRSDQQENFDINPSTGMVYVNKELDYETKSAYELIVIARDNGSQRLQTTAVVSITVLDVNDNEPTINLIFLTNDGTAKISETAEPGEYVARISVSDPDLTGSYYAHVNVTLEGGDGHFGLTMRDNVVYLVILAKPLDREIRPYYEMTVVATDSGVPPLKTSVSFQISVTDTNDNPPFFPRTTYYADIQEVVPIGSSVILVTARDQDEGNNSRITYKLLDTPATHSDWFHIDNWTGLITTRTRVDCETASEPLLKVVAKDSGVPPLSATATVVVRIQDVNDNQPIFDQSFYNVSVAEDTMVGQCILKVSASDPDCGSSARVTYRIALNLGFENPRELEVREETGEICVKAPLDYEKKHTYEFPLQARDQDGLDTTAMVKVTLRDINDNRPVFVPNQYNINLENDVAISSIVVIVRATDADSGASGQVRYSIISGNSQGLFSIHQTSGKIKLVQPLSRYPRVYNLGVEARDGGGKTSAINANVSISILDDSQRPPVFSQSLYSFIVPEDVPSDTLIGRVQATNTNPDAGKIVYSIVSGDMDGQFSVDSQTGEIKSSGQLDHDSVPAVLLNIQAESGSPPSYGRAQVNISISDVNDNTPTFSVSNVEIPVKENVAVNSVIYITQAVDGDSGDNGRITYSLQDQTGGSLQPDFTIDTQSGAIKLVRSLDYEGQRRHQVIVTARDNGRVPRQSTMTLTLEVQDVNDNNPVFTKSKYTVTIIETILPNTKFLQVSATDKDEGNNGRLSYLLQNSPNVDRFGIYADGFIYNRVNLDRENADQYVLHVVAMDSGIPPRSSSVEVSILVLDANDNSPVFQEESYVFYVEENLMAGANVGTVSAIDRDQTDSLRLQYHLVDQNKYFNIKRDSGQIQAKVPLDREGEPTHRFSVRVTDGGSPPLTASVNVLVHVLDKNDNSPVFEHIGPYRASVDENQPKGTLVTQVSARDQDKGDNGSVTYHFAHGSAGRDSRMFTIHPRTGQIKTGEVLDHETKDRYVFKVIARDNGHPSKETSETVHVDVNDINESPPLFEKTHYSFSIDENVIPGKVIGRVNASDADSGENGRVVYYLVEGNLFGTFWLNETTGDIIVSKPIDYEISSSYSLIIRAVDNSVINPMSSNIIVNITIRDHNDNAPVFEQDPIVITVRENEPIGAIVYTFSALDRDSGPRGTIHYSIADQSPENVWFDIGAVSGELKIAAAIDFEKITQISIQVEAEDQPGSGEKPLSSTVTARVLVEDANDNKPVFQTRAQVDIMEDEPVGYPIEHVLATDADSHENGRVSYAIVSGNEKGNFRIDSSTGLLSIARSLDRETKPRFRLNVTARDHGYPQQASYMTLTIHIIDVNDNPPAFQHSVYNATVRENEAINSFVTQIRARDPDTGKNAELQYLIPNGIADSKFTIGLTNGNVLTNVVLDREQKSSWVITAYVKDSAFPALYDTTTIMVKVTDQNDNRPVFVEPLYNLRVPENAQLAVIHTIVAMDADEGKNGHVTYKIIAGDPNNRFRLDSQSGKLSCIPLDREEGSFYNLTVAATDSGSPAQSSHTHIAISVLDENDNNPRFRKQFYTAAILENITVGQEILRVVADDADEGLNARVTYSISNVTEGLFKIDNTTGAITTAGTFDREKTSSYSFEVDAMDGGLYGPRSNRVRVDVTILDVNDNAPVFEQIPYKANISASQTVNPYVVKVVAVDKDEGANGEVVYSFVKPSQYFEIKPDSGVIVTKSVLGPEAVGVHTIDIVARDNGQRPKSSNGLVEVNVGNAPGIGSLRFNNLTYNVHIPENLRARTRIVMVTARFVSGRSGSISYSFASGNEDHTFSINSNTGEILVRDPKKLDYETNPRLRLIVVAAANTAYGYTTVWVNLRDVNDNSPRFTEERYISSVFEGNKDGTYVTQIFASDDDEGDNGRVTYTIIGGNIQNAFVIDPPNTGIVKTKFILDREIHESYRLEIEAVDGGVPPLSSRCTLKISVNDINDNAPFFPSYPPRNLRERSELGTLVLQVTANDKDLNPILNYDFTPDGNPGNTFTIDRYSGRITIAKPLDYEERTKYILKVKAADGTYNATTNLIVNIIDENDNRPEFTQSDYQVQLPELTNPGYSVLTVSARDRDAGENARLTYSIEPAGDFSINASSGVIYTNKKVTFNPGHHIIPLVVKAEDHGTPSLSQVAVVRLQIIDINNHAPVFSQTLYSGEVREDAHPGLTILSVAASDEDDSLENRKIDYSILQGNEGGRFQISTSTGDLLLTGLLDQETTKTYTLLVMAKDRGEPSLNSTTRVEVTVLDVNDNAPVFSLEQYSTVVAENVTTGHSILKVSATDSDTGMNARIVYYITSGNDLNNFVIDHMSGVISLRKSLDYETVTNHRLVIRAEDSSTNFAQQSAFTTVNINVTDVNEFLPRFPVMMYLESVYEMRDVGTSVFTAHANDNDGGRFGVVEYSIPNEQYNFRIDSTTGVVTTARRFVYTEKDNYRFSLRATDKGGEYHMVSVSVNILPKVEIRVQFVKHKYSFSLPGNATRGYRVGQVQAVSQQDGSTGHARYSLTKENEYLEVEEMTGWIVVKRNLKDAKVDRRRRRRALAEDELVLTIVASSGPGNVAGDKVTVVVTVDRSCVGCGLLAAQSGGDLSGTPLVLVIVFVIVAIILAVIAIIMYMRTRDRKLRLPETQYDSSYDHSDVYPPPPIRDVSSFPPTYNEIQHYPPRRHNHSDHNVTTSEISEQSHSASSGRGSAEDGDMEDAEIRMINATPLQVQNVRMPDSGIQQDDDTISEQSVQNHQEYLARLGIDSTKLNTKAPPPGAHNPKHKLANGKPGPGTGSSVESMHQFSDEGGGEEAGLDLGNLVSLKLNDMENDENMAIMDGTRQFGYGETATEPSHAGSLSSVINSEEEFSGSYNWDYLLDWGPQYQPLAHVFSEIARLKDDSIKPKKQPTHIVPQRPNMTALNSQVVNKTMPPPLLTNAPPMAVLAQPVSTRPSQGSGSSSSGSSVAVNSSRTSQLTSLPSLPRSPISHESSYTSPALSPSFTPSLSPLATRSPSISPLVTPKGISSSGHSSSGQNTPQRHRRPNTQHVTLTTAGSSESEQEIRI